MSLSYKLWWNFRTTNSILSVYMYKKYYKKENPNLVMSKKGKTSSQVWKKMLVARDLVEHLIIWQIQKRNSDIQLDNWTTQGDLYSMWETTIRNREISKGK